MSTIRLDFLAHSDFADELSDALLLLGAQAISLENADSDELYEPEPNETPLWENVWVGGYFDEQSSVSTIMEWVKDHFYREQNFEYKLITLADEDWNSKWQQYIKPMRFGTSQTLWVIPVGHESPAMSPEDRFLYLHPGLAFGTGTHETTSLCLNWLTDHIKGGEIVMDYGCGSGILAIAALTLGAKQAYGVDYDPQAITASRENARLNDLADDQLGLFLPEQCPELQCDIVVANILAKPIIELMPRFKALLRSKGRIILSGLLQSQVHEILETYQDHFEFETPENRNEWIRLVGTKK